MFIVKRLRTISKRELETCYFILLHFIYLFFQIDTDNSGLTRKPESNFCGVHSIWSRKPLSLRWHRLNTSYDWISRGGVGVGHVDRWMKAENNQNRNSAALPVIMIGTSILVQRVKIFMIPIERWENSPVGFFFNRKRS